jgi:hypothetical protein
MNFSVISEAGITGAFRIRAGVVECECIVVRRSPDGKAIGTWRMWRPANAFDHALARTRKSG